MIFFVNCLKARDNFGEYSDEKTVEEGKFYRFFETKIIGIHENSTYIRALQTLGWAVCFSRNLSASAKFKLALIQKRIVWVHQGCTEHKGCLPP
jgi:hypothetical protein